MILFLDTSALVKLYIAEPGSERMRKAASSGGPIAVSDLAFAEIHATFARRGREDLLLATELEQIRLVFADDWERLTQIPPAPIADFWKRRLPKGWAPSTR